MQHNSVFWYFNSVLSSVLQYFSSVLQLGTSVLNSPTCKFGFATSHAYSKFGNVIRNIQNKLGKRALKSDLKSTVIYTHIIYCSSSCIPTDLKLYAEQNKVSKITF